MLRKLSWDAYLARFELHRLRTPGGGLSMHAACLLSEAAAAGLTNIIKMFGGDTNLSPSLIVDRLNASEYETEVFLTSKVLQDIGYFKLAKNFDELSDFFLDKGKNLY